MKFMSIRIPSKRRIGGGGHVSRWAPGLTHPTRPISAIARVGGGRESSRAIRAGVVTA